MNKKFYVFSANKCYKVKKLNKRFMSAKKIYEIGEIPEIGDVPEEMYG